MLLPDQKWYEFITVADGIDYGVYWIVGKNPHNALIKYCKYTGLFNDARLDAVCAVRFDNAILLANEWLRGEILQIHEVGNDIFTASDCRIEVIE